MSEMGRKLAGEIAARGAIPFSRFMELALYCPVYGYYEAEADKIGWHGDYYTSGSVGRTWGEMLAWEFCRWQTEWETVGPQHPNTGRPWLWVEAGAHRAETARDALDWVRERRPEVYARLAYWIIEPSPVRRRRQEATLKHHAGSVRWFETILAAREAAGGGLRGIVFSNELLDAMPVQRFGWDARARVWFEWGVGLAGERFVWVPLDERGQGAPVLPPELLDVLPDGFIIERSPAAEQWWREAAEALRFGRLLTIDYGFTWEEKLRPERSGGTLRSYRAHRVSADVLADPGEQDITAHVDFSTIKSQGEAAGLRTVCLQTQAGFLSGIAARVIETAEGTGWPAGWTRQFQTLIHPEHLGRAFRVLVQERCP